MQPKKHLGQNFLKDQAVLEKIIQAADLKPEDSVIEIGPGTGVLTEELLKHARKIVAVEKDKALAERLNSRLRENKKIKIISGDILKINLPELIKENNFQDYKVVANIPYYITSPIIQLFLETEFPPREMILTVQKEVAERICASSGQMSILAVSVQYYARPELLFYVDKKSFWPVPEVDSAVIHITHSIEHGTKEEIRNFFRIVKAGFASKRKTLVNNLSNSLHLSKAETEEKIKKVPLSGTQRAQELSIDNWKILSVLFK
jgi:16S rRNA (adenine1518-N6/adenine1519-N6)-dimethyltransferase